MDINNIISTNLINDNNINYPFDLRIKKIQQNLKRMGFDLGMVNKIILIYYSK